MRAPLPSNPNTFRIAAHPSSVEQVAGTVQRVDIIGREICVLLPSGLAVVDLPPECPILLHGERIKLRLVQPGDQVRVTCAPARGAFIGKLLEVQPQQGIAAAAL